MRHFLNRGVSFEFLCPCFNVSVGNLILRSVWPLELQMELMRALNLKNQAAYLSSDIQTSAFSTRLKDTIYSVSFVVIVRQYFSLKRNVLLENSVAVPNGDFSCLGTLTWKVNWQPLALAGLAQRFYFIFSFNAIKCFVKRQSTNG